MSKKSKHRDCPALGRAITPADCGGGRMSRIPCPADCPHNPFTPENYDQFGEIESRVNGKAQQRLAKTLPAAEAQALLGRMEDGGDDAALCHAIIARALFWQRRADGRTIVESWTDSGLGGLNNDEQVLLSHQRGLMPALLEMRLVLDEQTFEAVDLLAGEGAPPLRIVDQSAASSLRRFNCILGWIYQAPYFWRMSGNAIIIPMFGKREPLEVLREITTHHGGPADLAALRLWVWDHYETVSRTLAAVQAARWKDTMSHLDARYGKARYRLPRGHAGLLKKLGAAGDVEPEEVGDEAADAGFTHEYSLLERAPKGGPAASGSGGPAASGSGGGQLFAPGEPSYGRILIGPDLAQVEGSSSERYARARQRFEALAGKLAEFHSERVDDMASQLKERRAIDYDPALVPPRLLEDPQIIQFQSNRVRVNEPLTEENRSAHESDLLAPQYENFADTPLPALDGRTPRQAAADAARRPALVRLMKSHVNQCDNLRHQKGIDIDLNPMLEDLGLHELVFPPPPLPDETEDFLDDADDFSADDDDLSGVDAEAFGAMLARNVPTELKQEPKPRLITPEDLARRVQAAFRIAEDNEVSIELFETNWPGLMSFAEQVTEDALSNEAFWQVIALMATAALVLHPRPPQGSGQTNHLRLVWRMREEALAFAKVATASNGKAMAMANFLRSSPQPIVSAWLCDAAMQMTLEKKSALKPDDAAIVLPLLKAVVWEMSFHLPPA